MLFTAHERRCTRDYKIPDTDIVIPKGRIVHVYFNHFVNSRKNFINPDNFDPENFNPDNKPNKFAKARIAVTLTESSAVPRSILSIKSKIPKTF